MLPSALSTVMFLCNCARSCCSLRRRNSEAVLTSVLKAGLSIGFGFFLSRPMVHGPIRVGSRSPSRVISTAQPSSSSFLMMRAVQPSSRHRRGSWMTSAASVGRSSVSGESGARSDMEAVRVSSERGARSVMIVETALRCSLRSRQIASKASIAGKLAAMEIELKLAIAPGDVDAFRQLPLLQQFSSAGAAPPVQDLFSTYFDTAGLHQRHEWECQVPGAQIELDLLLPLVDNPLARQALELPGLQAQLQEMFTTSFQRTIWMLQLPQDTVVELALDQGYVAAAGRRVALCELELELKSGQTEALLAFSHALRQALPLSPSNISKAQRGFALRSPDADSSL